MINLFAVRVASGRWLLICSWRKILLPDWWLIAGADLFQYKCTVGWWLIIQMNRLDLVRSTKMFMWHMI
jgi:hypothetical protein